MPVTFLSRNPVAPVTIAGTAHLSFTARASSATIVDVDCTIMNPNVVFAKTGTSFLPDPGHPVGVGRTTVALDVDLVPRGPIPPSFVIHGDVKENGIFQFPVDWVVLVLNPTQTVVTPPKGPKGGKGQTGKNLPKRKVGPKGKKGPMGQQGSKPRKLKAGPKGRKGPKGQKGRKKS